MENNQIKNENTAENNQIKNENTPEIPPSSVSQKIILSERTAWKHASKGLDNMGSGPLIEIIKHILDQNQNTNQNQNQKEEKVVLPWISVGSGNGVIETWMEDSFGIKVYRVDPNPNKFNPVPKDFEKMFHTDRNHYFELEKLMKEFPSLKGNCVLFLNWTYQNDSVYDMEAIEKLSPKYIVPVCEVTSGIAGGTEFHQWFFQTIIENEKNEKIKTFLNSNCYQGAWRKSVTSEITKYATSEYVWRAGKFCFGKDEMNFETTLSTFLLKRKDIKETETITNENILDSMPVKMEKTFHWKKIYPSVSALGNGNPIYEPFSNDMFLSLLLMSQKFQ